MIIDVLLFGWGKWEQPLKKVGLTVVQCDDLEDAIGVIHGSQEIKVALLEVSKSRDASNYLTGILRAKHERCSIGQAVPASEYQNVKDSKSLPDMMDFLLQDPFADVTIQTLVILYDQRKLGPPAGWNGWSKEPAEPGKIKIGFAELERQYQGLVEDMRRRMSPVDFGKWFKAFSPDMEERLQRVKEWEDSAGSGGNVRQ